MAEAAASASAVLGGIADIVRGVHSGIANNTLGRRNLKRLLQLYVGRTPSDGQLIDIAMTDPRCAHHALYLLNEHVALAGWLASNNFTVPAMPVMWCSPKKLLQKNRLPFWFADSKSTEFERILGIIDVIAETVLSDIIKSRVCDLFRYYSLFKFFPFPFKSDSNNLV
jgi:hypothetical protein